VADAGGVEVYILKAKAAGSSGGFFYILERKTISFWTFHFSAVCPQVNHVLL